jgi:predicted permease
MSFILWGAIPLLILAIYVAMSGAFSDWIMTITLCAAILLIFSAFVFISRRIVRPKPNPSHEQRGL